MSKIVSMKDIIDIKSFQKIQNDIAKATGVAIIATDYRGKPITKHSLCTEFCSIIRSNPKLRELCEKCDSRGGLEAARTEKPYIYVCHKGLVDFAIPIIVNEQYLGSLMSGQILTEDLDVKDLEKIIQVDNSDIKNNKIIMDAYKKLNIISLEKIRTIANMMFHIANYIVQEGNLKLIKEEVESKNNKIIQSSKNEMKLTQELKKIMLQEGKVHISGDFIFDMLNIISSLSLIEGAYKTHEIIGDFSKLMRYTLEKENKMVLIEDEIQYVQLYLNIYKLRYGDRLEFQINSHGEFQKLKIPVMSVGIFIENIINITLKKHKNQVHIKICLTNEENTLSVVIKFNEISINKEQDICIKSQKKCFHESLKNVEKRMNRFLGGNYNIRVDNNKEEGNIVIKIFNN